MSDKKEGADIHTGAEFDADLRSAVNAARFNPQSRHAQLAAFDQYIISGTRAFLGRDFELAYRHFTSGRVLLEQLLEIESADYDICRRLLIVLRHQREFYYIRYRMRDFLESLNDSLRICERFTYKWPDDLSWKVYVANLNFKGLQVALVLDERQSAVAFCERGLAIMDGLALQCPNNKQYASAVTNFKKYSQLLQLPIWVLKLLSIWSRFMVALHSTIRPSRRREYALKNYKMSPNARQPSAPAAPNDTASE